MKPVPNCTGRPLDTVANRSAARRRRHSLVRRHWVSRCDEVPEEVTHIFMTHSGTSAAAMIAAIPKVTIYESPVSSMLLSSSAGMLTVPVLGWLVLMLVM